MNQVGFCDDSSHFHIIWFTTAIIIYGPWQLQNQRTTYIYGLENT